MKKRSMNFIKYGVIAAAVLGMNVGNPTKLQFELEKYKLIKCGVVEIQRKRAIKKSKLEKSLRGPSHRREVYFSHENKYPLQRVYNTNFYRPIGEIKLRENMYLKGNASRDYRGNSKADLGLMFKF